VALGDGKGVRVGKDPVEELLRLSTEAGAAADRLRERRVAVSRFALVWWQGGAAQVFRDAFERRVAGLAATEAELRFLAQACHELAGLVAAESVASDVGSGLAS